MRLTVAYYRSSTKQQENSVEMQEYRAHDFAKTQVLAIHQEYKEPGVSARKKRVDERPQMIQLMNDIREGKIENLIVYKRDRLARRATEYMDFYRLCKRHQVKILFSAENEFPVYYTPLGEFIELIMAGMVEHEGNQIAERLSATHLANFLKGKTLQPRLPYGIKKVERKGKVYAEFASKEHQRTIRTIYQAVLDGDTDIREKHQFLSVINEEHGLTRDGKHGTRPWTWNEVLDVIENPIYRGVHQREFGGQLYARDQPGARVVSDEAWCRANAIIEPHKPKKRVVPPYTFLLEHVAKCVHCNQTLLCHTRHPKDVPTPTYECKACSVVIPAAMLHDAVLDEVLAYIDRLFTHHAGKLYRKYQNEQAKGLRAQIRRVKSSLQQAEDKFIEAVSGEMAFYGDFRDPTVVRKLEDLQKAVDTKRDELRDLEQKLHDQSLLPHVVKQRKDRLEKLRALIDEFLTKRINQLQVQELLEDITEQVRVDKEETVSLTLKFPFESIKEVEAR